MFSNTTIKNLKNCFLIILAFGLQACVGGDLTDLQRFVENEHKDKKPEIEPLPEIPPFKAFEYSSGDENDPFSVSNISSGQEASSGIGGANRPDANRRREPLEKFPLDALRMVGTITQDGAAHVVVKTNEGTALLAAVGNYMGQNDGKIKSILPEEQSVVLVETVLDPAGRWVTREVEVTIDE